MSADTSPLRSRRSDLGVSIEDVASILAASDRFDLATATLEGRLSAWERGDPAPEQADREAVEAALDAIEEEQNFEWPACEHPDCGRIPEKEPVDVSDLDVEGDSWCITCHYCEFGE